MWAQTIGKSVANRAAALTELWSQLSTMGWTLHDNQDGSSYRVYSSTSEDSSRLTGFIKIKWTTANQITYCPYYWWNASTHVGTGAGYSNEDYNPGRLTTSESGFYLWIYGNLDRIWTAAKISTTYNGGGFGFITPYWSLNTDLTSGATSGAGATLTVSDTTGFVVGESYQIVGVAGEGRDRVAISGISSGTQMTVTNLPRNYSTGSRIGITPHLFGGMGDGSYWFSSICTASDVGTGNAANRCNVMVAMIDNTYVDPDYQGNRYVLSPLLITDGTVASFIGYVDSVILNAPNTGMTNEDTFEITRRDNGTATSGGTAVLNDTGKSWTVDTWIGKNVIIIAGTGAGQIRKITDNTATQLTLDLDWVTPLSTDSQYAICDEAYRYLTTNKALREAM